MKRCAFEVLLQGSKEKKRQSDFDEIGSCPICGSKMSIKWISDHVDQCLTPKSDKKLMKEKDESKVLYSISRLPINGLFLIEDFLTVDEENKLLRFLDSTDQSTNPPWKASRFNGQCLSKAWGVKTEHGTYINKKVGFVRKNNPEKGELDLPPQFDFLLAKIQSLSASFEREFGKGGDRATNNIINEIQNLSINECNANSYVKSEGHHLRPHVDDRFLSGPLLVNLSLAGRAKMRYQLEKEVAEARKSEVGVLYQGLNMHHYDSVQSIDVELPRRALQIVAGAARYDYEHSLPNHLLGEDRRVSITLRMAGDKRKGVLGQQPTGTRLESFLMEKEK